jgi:hypothetical protein
METQQNGESADAVDRVETEREAAPPAEPLRVLGKTDILKADDIVKELVPVPEWGGAVYVKTMTGPERDQFELSCITGKGKTRRMSFENVRAIAAAFTICDETGKRLFQANEVIELGRKSGTALSRVWEAAARLNGLTQEDVEELAGNSGDGPSDVS